MVVYLIASGGDVWLDACASTREGVKDLVAEYRAQRGYTTLSVWLDDEYAYAVRPGGEDVYTIHEVGVLEV